MKRLVTAAILASLPGIAVAAPVQLNDFPTEARADYVLGCMTANASRRTRSAAAPARST